jgi:host factor-I protein
LKTSLILREKERENMSDKDQYRGQSFSRHSQGETDAARKKLPPPVDTNAEVYYYKKQIDTHTLMVVMLNDGEEIEGTIEWYDRDALKINRKDAPNVLLLKHNIKYIFKAEDRK